jgi:uncharacterized protein (DUF2342 family)
MEVADAMRLAELWLDAVTALPAGATSASAGSHTSTTRQVTPSMSPRRSAIAKTMAT